MSHDSKPKFVTKTVAKTPETGPTENLKVKFKKFGVEYIRFFLGGPDGETPSEYIFHRPIGVNNLDDDDWVSSTPSDVELLEVRKTSPNTKKLSALRIQFKREKAVAANLVQVAGDGSSLRYPSGTARTDFLKPYRDKAEKSSKTANAAITEWKQMNKKSRPSNPPVKIDVNDFIFTELNASSSDDAKAEIAFTKFMSGDDLNIQARAKHPDLFVTKKGTTADVPQESLKWCKGLTPAQLQVEMTKVFAILTGRKVKSQGIHFAAAFTLSEKKSVNAGDPSQNSVAGPP
jgi:hypothetical protein